eukprot:4707432-Amphidinium_carterae.1
MPRNLTENKTVEFLMEVALGEKCTNEIVSLALQRRHGIELSTVSIAETVDCDVEPWTQEQTDDMPYETADTADDGGDSEDELITMHSDLRENLQAATLKKHMLQVALADRLPKTVVVSSAIAERKYVKVPATGIPREQAL